MKPPELRKAAMCVNCRNSASSISFGLDVKCLKYNCTVDMDNICASYEEPLTGEVNE